MRILIKNIIGILCVIAAILVAMHFFLLSYTRHGHTFEVPDFTKMSIREAEVKASSMGLRTEVIDSLFIQKFPRGAIYHQLPAPGSHVKKNRRIQFTINSVVAKEVEVPSLVGYSLRQAKAELAASGLQLGKLVYTGDIATNNVLDQMYKGKSIAAGTKVEDMSQIDLLLGLSDNDNVTFVPDLLGKDLKSAKDLITDYSLNVGKVSYNKSIKTALDTLSAKVVRQYPESSSSSYYVMGTGVDIVMGLPKE